MDITKDIKSLTEFKRDTARFMSRLKKTGQPSILTVNGKPELVVMDAKAWQESQDQIEFSKTVNGIQKGLEQVRQGQGMKAGAFFDGLVSSKS